MPLYEYECLKCQRLDELLVRISDTSTKLCSSCQGPMRKLISQTSFVLKGQGWYVTDFRDKKHNNSTAPESSSNTAKTSSKSSSSKPPAQSSES